MEHLVIDIPRSTVGRGHQKIGPRRGAMVRMVNHGTGARAARATASARGLIGVSNRVLTDTRDRTLNHCSTGGTTGRARSPTAERRLVAGPHRATTAYAIDTPGAGTMSRPVDVRGQIVGENSRDNDMDVNITKRRAHEHARVHRGRRRQADPAPQHEPRAVPRVDREDELLEVTTEVAPPAQARARRASRF